MYRKTTYSLLVGLFLSVSILTTGCGDSAANGEQAIEEASATAIVRTVRVNTITMAPGSFEEIIPLTGTLFAPNDASLSAQTSGTIVEMVEIGTRVKEGDVVARLDDRLIRAALDQARANFESVEAQARLAQDTYRRQEPLFADSIISAIEFENVRTALNQANAALSQAQATVVQAEQQFEYTYVRAPFDGGVEERFAEKGEQVAPGLPIARVVDTSMLKLQAGVPERYAADIKSGNTVRISFRAYEGSSRESNVTFVAGVIHPQNRTFNIEVEVENGDLVLKPEMIADVQITRRVLQDVLVLPQTAILRDENGSSVYIVNKNASRTTAERKSIELGPSFGGQTVIEAGLTAGDEVISTGQTMVAEDDQVEIINAP